MTTYFRTSSSLCVVFLNPRGYGLCTVRTSLPTASRSWLQKLELLRWEFLDVGLFIGSPESRCPIHGSRSSEIKQHRWKGWKASNWTTTFIYVYLLNLIRAKKKKKNCGGDLDKSSKCLWEEIVASFRTLSGSHTFYQHFNKHNTRTVSAVGSNDHR